MRDMGQLEALEIVLDLARENMLDPDRVEHEDNALMAVAEKQALAIEIVENLILNREV